MTDLSNVAHHASLLGLGMALWGAGLVFSGPLRTARFPTVAILLYLAGCAVVGAFIVSLAENAGG